jgi:hypothetical protein
MLQGCVNGWLRTKAVCSSAEYLITVSNFKRSDGLESRYPLGGIHPRLYAHKNIKGSRKKSEVVAFANTLVTELSTVGKTMTMLALNTKIKDCSGLSSQTF